MEYASYEKVENLYKSAPMFRLMTIIIMTGERINKHIILYILCVPTYIILYG